MSLLYDDIYDDLAKLETRQPSYATIQTIVCRLKLSVRLYLMWFTHISGFRFGNKASIPYVCILPQGGAWGFRPEKCGPLLGERNCYRVM